MKGDALDPKGLIVEDYRIENVTEKECRSIFLDWALSLPADRDQTQALTELHAAYATENAEHPMTKVLREGLQTAQAPKRRGGWRGRDR